MALAAMREKGRTLGAFLHTLTPQGFEEKKQEAEYIKALDLFNTAFSPFSERALQLSPEKDLSLIKDLTVSHKHDTMYPSGDERHFDLSIKKENDMVGLFCTTDEYWWDSYPSDTVAGGTYKKGYRSVHLDIIVVNPKTGEVVSIEGDQKIGMEPRAKQNMISDLVAKPLVDTIKKTKALERARLLLHVRSEWERQEEEKKKK
ncbi:MAG: hypothetical protein NTV98_04555 [Candidatus Roizmanbacteria bacterium]|nr:hypothetical protein [Candidatus Roizmanbacteria bacterium]